MIISDQGSFVNSWDACIHRIKVRFSNSRPDENPDGCTYLFRNNRRFVGNGLENDFKLRKLLLKHRKPHIIIVY